MFEREGAVSSFLPVLPYLSMPADGSDGLSYESRDSKRHARGHSYSSAYGNSSDLANDNYGGYSSSQVVCQMNIFPLRHELPPVHVLVSFF